MYIKNGDVFWPTSEANLDIHKTLGSGVYEVKVDKDRGFFFQQAPAFRIPPKLYGDISDTADRILNTYSQREGTTGIMLDGLKGSGKTMLAKLVSARAGESLNIPTILIGSPFTGPSFNSLIRNLPKAVIIFDEFEKMYDMEDGDQNELLSLFDGVFTSHSLILVTCNDSYQVSDFFKNRPGRIYYNLEFGGLDQKFVKDYCDDKLLNQNNAEQVLEITGFAGNYSFDMVQALIEEMNRYNESAKEALKFLNFEANHKDSTWFNVNITMDGTSFEGYSHRGLPVFEDKITVRFVKEVPDALVKAEKASRQRKYMTKNPDEFTISLDDEDKDDDGDKVVQKEVATIVIDKNMLISKDTANKVYTYRHPNGAVIVFTPRTEGIYNYLDII